MNTVVLISNVFMAELAHQWFGNLVTMDWWNELWLNEGFATWVGWLAVDHFYPGKLLLVKERCIHDFSHASRVECLVPVCRTQFPR